MCLDLERRILYFCPFPSGGDCHHVLGASLLHQYRHFVRDAVFEADKDTDSVVSRDSLCSDAHDNAVAEAFFSTLKREELSHNRYNSSEELEETIREYIEFYNFKRPHRKLNLQSPDQFEQNYWNTQISL